MNKRISVIIPVYNGETYITRCIESVLQQKQIDIDTLEVLLLNDGSTDSSLDILMRYAENYPQIIRLINHENMGVARTRNKGIGEATGTYIIFIDQDDWIDQDYCAVLLSAIEDGEYDAVFSGMKRPNEAGKIINKDIYKTSTDAYFARFLCLSVWAKIHKTEFLRTAGIELFDNAFGEDVVFVFEEVQNTEKIKCIEYCGYNWFYNSTSVSNTSQRQLVRANTTSLLALQDKLAQVDQRKDKNNTFFVLMITAYYIFLAGKGSTVADFMSGSAALMTNLSRLYPDWDKNPTLVVAPKGTLLIFSIGVKLFVILYKLRLLRLFAKIYCRKVSRG